jgi:threonine/homoserine/homoserine lactone efflux protein
MRRRNSDYGLRPNPPYAAPQSSEVDVMELALALATLAFVQLMAVMSPGQSFLFIVRTAIADGRPPALAATLGMGVGSCIWAVAAMLGMAIVLQQAAWAYALLKIAGGLYLIYLAVMVWRHASNIMDVDGDGMGHARLSTAFGRGLLIQIGNPKVVVFFGSIFFALLPASAPLWVLAAAVLIVFVNETAWYALVSVLFSARKPRGAYMRLKPLLDRLMAGLLGLIGAKLIADAR